MSDNLERMVIAAHFDDAIVTEMVAQGITSSAVATALSDQDWAAIGLNIGQKAQLRAQLRQQSGASQPLLGGSTADMSRDAVPAPGQATLVATVVQLTAEVLPTKDQILVERYYAPKCMCPMYLPVTSIASVDNNSNVQLTARIKGLSQQIAPGKSKVWTYSEIYNPFQALNIEYIRSPNGTALQYTLKDQHYGRFTWCHYILCCLTWGIGTYSCYHMCPCCHACCLGCDSYAKRLPKWVWKHV